MDAHRAAVLELVRKAMDLAEALGSPVAATLLLQAAAEITKGVHCASRKS